jgi:DNA-binding CsgD family transcriptional regulator
VNHQCISRPGEQQEDLPSDPSTSPAQQKPAPLVSPSKGQADWALLWLDRQPRPHVILSEDLTILWTNARARTILADQRDIHSRDQTFAAIAPEHQQELHDFLASSGSSLASWSMPRSDGDGRLIFRAQRLEDSASSVIMVSFFGSGSDFQSVYADLDRVFKLTKAQLGTLLDLLGGHDADTIAQLRNVSVETVRTHIRIIYSKIGVNSREALFHILQPFRL